MKTFILSRIANARDGTALLSIKEWSGVGIASSIAAAIVHRPSPESDT